MATSVVAVDVPAGKYWVNAGVPIEFVNLAGVQCRIDANGDVRGNGTLVRGAPSTSRNGLLYYPTLDATVRSLVTLSSPGKIVLICMAGGHEDWPSGTHLATANGGEIHAAPVGDFAYTESSTGGV